MTLQMGADIVLLRQGVTGPSADAAAAVTYPWPPRRLSARGEVTHVSL
jgi:hypothetical protein